ncbi:MAG: S41 family peptidase [Gemmatimonadaceae bacterium]
MPSIGLGIDRLTRRRWASAVALVATLACGRGDAGTTAPPTGGMSAQARSYLEGLIGIMQANSINRLTLDWPTFRGKVLGATPNAQTISDTYPAITEALRLLGDGHSSFRTATGAVLFVPTKSCRGTGTGVAAIPATIGYVRVRSFSGTAEQALTFADGLQSTIRAADHDSIIGWIVDLRSNGGGNMWPMIAGIGPVLGEGLAGYFIGPTGVESNWEYRSGASWNAGFRVQSVTTPYTLRKERPKVAVLIDNGIASSGEATLIAFIQRPNTRTFGTATCGLSTANQGFPIQDGALLNLTVAVMADRTKRKFGDQIPPDELVPDPTEMVWRAIAWLRLPN